ncbi:hypothetical protein KTJ32_09275 [Acinetobacter gyllenbergii]|uniref:hypothetical protein n=1 Tax=Acinetobacter gyllenbergii TaxID=134534 RepID=UPI0021D1ED24|nr:hypothetical protein [Acinetobacter gyllenbergii]MCU4581176.1 hypothetical protein [Acinetobacter gyllenbergii]
MFIQHNEYYINTSTITYFKVSESEKKVLVFFGGVSQTNLGEAVTLQYNTKSELDALISKLKKW